jgi:hypothetical protein
MSQDQSDNKSYTTPQGVVISQPSQDGVSSHLSAGRRKTIPRRRKIYTVILRDGKGGQNEYPDYRIGSEGGNWLVLFHREKNHARAFVWDGWNWIDNFGIVAAICGEDDRYLWPIAPKIKR